MRSNNVTVQEYRQGHRREASRRGEKRGQYKRGNCQDEREIRTMEERLSMRCKWENYGDEPRGRPGTGEKTSGNKNEQVTVVSETVETAPQEQAS